MIGILIAAAVLGVVGLTAAALLGYRRLRQRRAARPLVIDTPRGIAESGYVRVGGIDQWVQIRGRNRTNPVVLVLGGSGLTLEPFTARLRAWEEHFTVAVWDRREIGRTRGRNGKAGADAWTFEQSAADGIEIAEHLCRRLNQDKIILLGHSQGSIIGTLMARQRPDLFHAYVGAGQVVDMARNEVQTHRLALQGAQAAGNTKAVKALEKLAPPYRDANTWITKQRWSMSTDPEMPAWQSSAMTEVLFWPGYSLADVYRSVTGALFLPRRMFEQIMACTPDWLGTTFGVPIVLLHGAADSYTLPALAQEYIAALDAPVKDLVLLPGCGHMAVLTQPERILDELVNRVLPLTRPKCPPQGAPARA
jgi:pimeloyl-ACP methyl ester carboxylesterase